jgi:flagellar protein FlaF
VPNQKNIQEYQQNQIPTEGNPRHNEAWALIEVARRMAAVIQYGDLNTKEDKEKLRDAMRLNLRVWTVIQAEQTVGDNLLPDPIRQNILNLCGFIDKHTMLLLPKPTPEKVIVLININQNIASGLLGSPDEASAAAEAEPSEQNDDASQGSPPSPTEIEA